MSLPADRPSPLPQGFRFHDAGLVSPYALHARYEGLASALGPDDAPWLVLARADRGHMALGASQSAEAELNLAHCRLNRIPVVQRALGGGTVWVDEHQLCLFFIFPRCAVPRGHAALFDECLGLLVETFQRVGVPVERVGEQDLWYQGRKLLGSGAATVGEAMVFGASLLERFDGRRFAACLNVPAGGFSTWLADALSAGMTDLSVMATPPDREAWIQALRAVCSEQRGLAEGLLTPSEWAAIVRAEHLLRLPLETGGRRLVRGGLKINRETYLVEDAALPWIRILLNAGRLMRAACRDERFNAALQDCLGHPLDVPRLQARAREKGIPEQISGQLVQRVLTLCDIPGLTG